MKEKPSIEEVLKYAKPQIFKFIAQYAKDVPAEHREEMEQCAYIRLVEAYDGLEADSGWKSYVYNHCRGAVLDYLKFGHGFHEQRWSLAKPEEVDSKFVSKIRDRLALVDQEDGEVDVDFVLGAHGVFSEMDSNRSKIRWDLVARMASQDECIHALAKFLLDYGALEMAPAFDKCRSRIGQLIDAAIARFDDPEWADEIWFKQMCFAFGICEHLGLPDVDQSTVVGYSVGWSLDPVDLYDVSALESGGEQLNLFDAE